MKNTLSQTDTLKMRVMKLKPLQKDHTEVFMVAYPEYNNMKGLNTYRNVVTLRTADEKIIEKMEAIFSKKSKKAKA
jgi:hypothetical protein